ncbi:MAG: hydrogenase formation protein HypD [Clostridiales Family XIII bacterium]|jgi:hydrogenase expression/formation protein HypD|nr:hydrogenase formation protein HypD [Clostridiales Family XIII bacterium]
MDSLIQKKIEYLSAYDGPPLRLMEVCGTHTAGIFKSGIRSFLSPKIRLISGPGCPVCVTPAAYIDRCIAYALTPKHALASFGDMLKVPGSERSKTRITAAPDLQMKHSNVGRSLSDIRGEGGRVEMVYAPFDVTSMAKAEPDTTFVIAAVGFETTAPAYGLLLDDLIREDIHNVKLLTSLKRAIPAIEWICENEPDVDGFLCPGHVSVITGSDVYLPLSLKYDKPFVIAGFEPEHLVNAIYELVQTASGQTGQETRVPDPKGDDSSVSNLYGEAVTAGGNLRAKIILEKYFEQVSVHWRGLGEIRDSGLYLKPEYEAYDAGSRTIPSSDADLPIGCRCADVITGRIDPNDCPLFGKTCTPDSAIGPCMVSPEGACGIWYRNVV